MFFPIAIVALAVAANASPTSRGHQASARLQTPLASRIIGGLDATIESHPYQVSVQIEGEHFCGAVIIGKNWLLTGAHCLVWGIGGMLVRAGSSLVNEGGSLHRVVAAHLHERYQTNEHNVILNDIGLLRVEEAFVFDETRQPIVMFASKEKAPAGASGVVSGWGSTSATAIELPVQLKSVVVPVQDKQLCDRAYESFGGLPPGLICAGFYGLAGKDSCVGDSGGPLVFDGRLAAWSYDCTNPHLPGMYTEIAYLRDWIDEHAAVLGRQPANFPLQSFFATLCAEYSE